MHSNKIPDTVQAGFFQYIVTNLCDFLSSELSYWLQ